MKIQQTVFLWKTEGGKIIRAFTIGSIDLNYFDASFRADGALHQDFQQLNNEDAITHLSYIIGNMITSGYSMEQVHYSLVGIDDYGKALNRYIELSKQQIN